VFFRLALFMLLFMPTAAQAQSFSDRDIDRILASYELGAYDQIQILKMDLIDSESGFKMLQSTPDHATTQVFVEFGRRTNSEAIDVLEKIRKEAGFSTLNAWALIHDRVLGIANAALLTGWGLHSDDPRYDDPDYPDTFSFMIDTSQPWAKRVQAKEEFKQWCESICVNAETQEADIQVLAPRYLEVVKKLLPKGS